jgi:hypothetical protein
MQARLGEIGCRRAKDPSGLANSSVPSNIGHISRSLRVLASRDHAHFGGDELLGLFQGRRHDDGYLSRKCNVMEGCLCLLVWIDEGSGDELLDALK